MIKLVWIAGLMLAALALPTASGAQQLEYFEKPVRGVPVSSAVKVGNFIFVSGTPAYKDGKIAIGDFSAQMKQVMENIAGTLKLAGTSWDRVVKTNVMLTRSGDFDDMNRIYTTYFSEGKYPARTTVVVAGLPSPDFLLEIECEAAPQ